MLKKSKNIIIVLLLCLCLILCNLTFMCIYVFADELSVTDIPSCSATIDDESNISSDNPTGKRSATLDVSYFGNNKIFSSNADIKTTNFLFRLNFVDSGKNYSEFRLVTLISAKNNDVVLEDGRNQSGENFLVYQSVINPSAINYNGNTKVKKTSNIAYYVTFDNLSTYNTDMMNYLRNYATTGEFSQATININNADWVDGDPITNTPISCPSNAAFDALLYFDNFYEPKDKNDKDYRSIGCEVSFYPDEVLGKSITLNYTYDTNTYVKRKLTALESLKHPTYYNTSKSYPKIKLTYTTSLSYDIPNSIEELQDIANLSVDEYADLYLKSGIYYNSKSHKIVIRHFMKYKEYKEIIHNLIKNYNELKIGKAICKDCNGEANIYINKYKHIGKPFSVSLKAQLSQNNVKSNVFSFSAEFFSKSQGGIYYNPDNDTTLDKDHNDNLIFNGTDKDGTKNDYLTDERYDQALDDNKIEDMEFKDAVSWLKSLTKSLKDFPEFFADYFAFIPWASTYAQLVMCLLIIGVVVGFLKLLLS